MNNTKFLTTNFDVHLMLQDILGISVGKPRQELFSERKNKFGVSLLEEVRNRTCQEAGVPLLYCSCDADLQKMDPEDPIIVAIAQEINSETKDE